MSDLTNLTAAGMSSEAAHLYSYLTEFVDDHADWYTLGAFRGCDAHAHEHGINYTAHMESTGPKAIAAALLAADREGMRCTLDDWHDEDDGTFHKHCYAVLDIRSADGSDILSDKCIPTREVFDWWVGFIELRATSSDCAVDEPAAHAATYGFLR